MQERRGSREVELAVVGVALIIAAVFVVWWSRAQFATARGTAASFEAALPAQGPPGLGAASSPDVYAAVLQQLSTSTWTRAQQVYYQVIPALAQTPWRTYHQKAYSLAYADYHRLRSRVDELGRTRVAQLGGEERVRLVETNGYSGYVVRAGLAALPPEERSLLGDEQSVVNGDERDVFVQSRGWALLPADDRAVLGAAEALSSEETPAKLAFYDRVAIPKLSSEDQQAIAGFARPTVASLPVFAAHHGEAGAT